jgi:hypothetical protein
MNALFGTLSSEGLEEAQDRLGGFSRLDTGSYTGLIKVAYAGQSAGGARNITIVADLDGREFSETVYITNKKGENFYSVKDKDKKETGKKAPLPGFTTVDDICLVTTGEPLMAQPTEDKILKIYDPEARAEMPKSVPVLTELTGKMITLGIVKTLENKSVNDGNGNYIPTEETREVNSIDKVFEATTKATVVEAKQAAEAGTAINPVFHDAWVEKNQGKTRDKTDKSIAGSAGAGRPGRPAGAPPQAGNATTKKSLFA